MQCLAGAILVIVLFQNSLGQNENDSGCGEKPSALNHYMRRLNNAENELERPEKPVDPNDPEARAAMFRYKTRSYYPTKNMAQPIDIGPSGGWVMSSSSHSLPSVSSFVQYGMSDSSNMNTLSHSIKYKVNIPMEELIQRIMKLCLEWPGIKVKLEMSHRESFRDIMRAVFESMYPEWGNMKMDMIFGGVNDEAVLKNLFLAIFPNWPHWEINDIFAPTNTIPLIIKKLLQYIVPDMVQNDIDFIFSNTNSLRLILQRICEVMFPSMKEGKGADIFGIGNSVTNIFDGLLRGFFPQIHEFTPIQMDTVYTVLFPGMSYNITSSEPNLLFLLSQYKNSQSMPIEPSKRENILMLILLEWLKQNPHITYNLPRPGTDDFDNFKLTFFQNTPPNTIVPHEFQDDNFLRELFELWKRFIAGRFPKDTQIDLQNIRGLLAKFIQDKISNININVPSPGVTVPPTTQPSTMDEIPKTINIKFIDNLKNVLPADVIRQLIELFNLPDKPKSAPLIINILSNWQKYKLNNRVPLSKLMELILRIVVNNWPDVDVERVVGRNLSLEQILINLCKVMFLEWPNVTLDGKINSPQFILEMLLKKALPKIPKQKIEAAIDGSHDMERVLHRVIKMLYPHWPTYDPSNMHFDSEVMEKILSEMINWPHMKSTIIAKGVVSIPLLVESFIHAIFPSWPQYIVSMITVGRTPLPLIVQKIIQMIGINRADKEVVLHYDEQSSMVQISEAVFRKIFPDWPNYLAVLNILNRRERALVLAQLLKVVHGSVVTHENSLQCINDRDSNWAFALFIALMKYVQQESVLHSNKMF